MKTVLGFMQSVEKGNLLGALMRGQNKEEDIAFGFAKIMVFLTHENKLVALDSSSREVLWTTQIPKNVNSIHKRHSKEVMADGFKVEDDEIVAFCSDFLFIVDPQTGSLILEHNFYFLLEGSKQMVMFRDALGNDRVIANDYHFFEFKTYPEINSASEVQDDAFQFYLSKLDQSASSVEGI